MTFLVGRDLLPTFFGGDLFLRPSLSSGGIKISGLSLSSESARTKTGGTAGSISTSSLMTAACAGVNANAGSRTGAGSKFRANR